MIAEDTLQHSSDALTSSNHQVRFVESLADIDAAAWNALAGDDYPFLRHEFLLALEQCGCTTAESGWFPQHVLVEAKGGGLVAAMPLYVKSHSMGEYVFDWSWADAYQRHGLDYYPKLVSSIPFTPCAGPRLVVAPSVHAAAITALVQQAVLARAEELRASGWHVLFPEEDLRERLQASGLLVRSGCQYQWFNRGYRDFDDYLATFASRKRKTLRKERSVVADAGVQLSVLEGSEVSDAQWSQFYQFYASTYRVRGRRPYLNDGFFRQIGHTMPQQLMLVLGRLGDDAIAGALFFKGRDTLYGRYWGASRDVACLHFEACYYQGIDYCIQHGLQRMDSGAQGEHKIQRGFEPVNTWSLHWIAHPQFRRAIADFIVEEQAHVSEYMQRAAAWLPFRKDLQLPP